MAHTLKIEISSDHNPSATPLGGTYPVEIIRKRLSADELYPENQRYNDTTGEVEYTPDGGSTWIPAPELDPRNQTNIPPRPGSDINCQGAASVAEYFKRYVTLVVQLLSASATLVQGISAIVAFLKVISGAYAILWEVISGVFATLTGFGATTISMAFDDTVYHTFACILNCNMDSHGQIDQARLDAVKNQVSDQIGGTAADVINLMLDVMGFAGVNRAASFYSMDEDCSDCGCGWCKTWDFTINNGGWTPGEISNGFSRYGTYVPGTGWRHTDGQSSAGANYSRDVALEPPDFGGSMHLTEISMTFERSGGSGDGGVIYWWRFRQDLTSSNIAGESATYPGPSGTITKTWTGSLTLSRLIVDVRASYKATPVYSGSAIITSITLKGTGDNPFGADNC